MAEWGQISGYPQQAPPGYMMCMMPVPCYGNGAAGAQGEGGTGAMWGMPVNAMPGVYVPHGEMGDSNRGESDGSRAAADGAGGPAASSTASPSTWTLQPVAQVWDPVLRQLVPEGTERARQEGSGVRSGADWADASAAPFVPSAHRVDAAATGLYVPLDVPRGDCKRKEMRLQNARLPRASGATNTDGTDQHDIRKSSEIFAAQLQRRGQDRRPDPNSTVGALNLESARKFEPASRRATVQASASAAPQTGDTPPEAAWPSSAEVVASAEESDARAWQAPGAAGAQQWAPRRKWNDRGGDYRQNPQAHSLRSSAQPWVAERSRQAAAAPVTPVKAPPQEEEKPFSAMEFPSLAAVAAPGAARKGKNAKGAKVELIPEPVVEQPTEAKLRIEGTAWGKKGEEARKQVVAQREEEEARKAEAAPAEAAPAEAAPAEAAPVEAAQEDEVPVEAENTDAPDAPLDDTCNQKGEKEEEQTTGPETPVETAKEVEDAPSTADSTVLEEDLPETCSNQEQDPAIGDEEADEEEWEDLGSAEKPLPEQEVESERPVEEARADIEEDSESPKIHKVPSLDDDDDDEEEDEEDDDDDEAEESAEQHRKADRAEPSTCTPTTSDIESPQSEDSMLAGSFHQHIESMLQWRALVEDDAPEEIANLVASEDATAWRALDKVGGSTPKDRDRPVDRRIFGTRITPTNSRRDRDRMRNDRDSWTRDAESIRAPTLQVSENAYRRPSTADALSRDEELKRCTQSLLNKICPENVSTISSRITQEAHPQSVHELHLVIGLIFRKALTEPHYCETYADLVYHLKSAMPEFPSETEGAKPVTFKSTLLNVVQNEFESMPRTLELEPEEAAKYDEEELKFRKAQRKASFLANMKFIGHLFLRQLLATKIIAQIVQELMLCERSVDALPEEHVVECICELLTAIGYTLEKQPSGRSALEQVCGRLLDLKQRKNQNGKGVLSKRIQFNIQDLFDIRNAGWVMKVHKPTAKTKEEVRLEQKRAWEGKGPKDASGAEFVVAGQRPAYLDPATAGQVGTAAGATEDWQEISKSKKDRR